MAGRVTAITQPHYAENRRATKLPYKKKDVRSETRTKQNVCACECREDKRRQQPHTHKNDVTQTAPNAAVSAPGRRECGGDGPAASHTTVDTDNALCHAAEGRTGLRTAAAAADRRDAAPTATAAPARPLHSITQRLQRAGNKICSS